MTAIDLSFCNKSLLLKEKEITIESENYPILMKFCVHLLMNEFYAFSQVT